MSGAASITPVWQQVKPTDVSNYLEGMDRAYTNQQQAIKDQIKVFDTALANAQQHKMNEVQQAINAQLHIPPQMITHSTLHVTTHSTLV